MEIAEKLELGNHEAGYEWEAGKTPPKDSQPGSWVVKLTDKSWQVVFRPLSAALQGGAVIEEAPAGTSLMTGPEYPIQDFEPTDSGERQAKVMALKIVDVAWGREPEG